VSWRFLAGASLGGEYGKNTQSSLRSWFYFPGLGDGISAMRILYVHERFGALAGAEANAHITASELGKLGHSIGILHGPSTGRNETGWQATFPHRFALAEGQPEEVTSRALSDFRPDVVYVHKMADLRVIATLVESGVPLVRMVHDHDIYCMRSYKYDYFTRKICTRPVGLHCIVPCLASVVRNHEGPLPVKWVSLEQVHN
jgi:hypothetical protein